MNATYTAVYEATAELSSALDALQREQAALTRRALDEYEAEYVAYREFTATLDREFFAPGLATGWHATHQNDNEPRFHAGGTAPFLAPTSRAALPALTGEPASLTPFYTTSAAGPVRTSAPRATAKLYHAIRNGYIRKHS